MKYIEHTITVKNYKPPVGYAPAERLPDTQHKVVIEIDDERLARELGTKAVRSKGKKAQECSGLIVVRAKS